MNIPPEIWNEIMKYSHVKPFYTIRGNPFMLHSFRVHLDKQCSFDIPVTYDRSDEWYIGINPAQITNALGECAKKVAQKEDFVFSWRYGESNSQFGTDRHELFNLSWSPEKSEATYSEATMLGLGIRYTMQQEQFLSLLAVLREVAIQDSSAHGPWKEKGDDYIEPYLEYFRPYIRKHGGILREIHLGRNFCFNVHMQSRWIPTQIVSALDECGKKMERGEKFTFSWLIDKNHSKFNITSFPENGYATYHKKRLPDNYEPFTNDGDPYKQEIYSMSQFRFRLLIQLLREMVLSEDSPPDHGLDERWNQEGDDYIEPYITNTHESRYL